MVIITFRTRSERFESDYERNKFFRGLYGWKQIVPKNHRRYLYHRAGLLDDIDHEKIADSVLMVAMKDMQRVMRYFQQWNDKVECEAMEVYVRKRSAGYK
mgnify:FL=1